jgi:hypothetical protein
MMTNLRSLTGSMVWALIAGLLLLATFEPVTVEQGEQVQLSATAPSAAVKLA